MLKIKCDKLGRDTKVYLNDKDVTDALSVYKIDINIDADKLTTAVMHCWLKTMDLEIFEDCAVIKKVSFFDKLNIHRERKARIKKRKTFEKKRAENKKRTCQA